MISYERNFYIVLGVDYSMDIVNVPASITLEKSKVSRKYNWKSDEKKQSVYTTYSKRAFIRFSCVKFSN